MIIGYLKKLLKLYYLLIGNIVRGANFKNKLQMSEKILSTKHTIVANIDTTSVKPQRAGVILWTKIDNEIFFGFGIDTKTKELTDFAGGINYKKDKTVVLGALRECKEETLGLYALHELDVACSPVIYDTKNLIIFIKVESCVHPIQISKSFAEKYKYQCSEYSKRGSKELPEVCGIRWLDERELYNAVHGTRKGVIFSRVKNFLSRSGNIVTTIKTL